MDYLVQYRSLTAELEKINETAAKENRSALNADEQKRYNEITVQLKDVEVAIERQKDLDAKKAFAQVKVTERSAAPANKPDYSKTDGEALKGFSLARSIQNMAFGKKMAEEDSFVAQRGSKLMEESKVAFGDENCASIAVPADALSRSCKVFQKRANDITITGGSNGNQGGVALQTDVLAPQGVLWNPRRLQALGTTFIGGLVHDTKIPRPAFNNLTASNPAFFAETGANSTSASYTLEGVTLSPKRLSAYIDVSKQSLIQLPFIQEFIVNELSAQLMSYVEYAVLNGASNGMTGLLATSGIINPSLASGNTLTYVDIANLMANLENRNILDGPLGFLTSPNVKRVLKTTAKIGSTYPVFIWEDGQKVYELPIEVTPNVPTATNANILIAGKWDDLVVGQFGAPLEVIVDQYTQAASGKVRIYFNIYIDSVVRRKESFAFFDTIAAAVPTT